jgi:Pilin accessory protein (PilO)
VALRIPDDKEEHKLTQISSNDRSNVDQYMYVAIHDGIILADGDMVGTIDEIRVRLIGDAAYEAWEVIICPDDWGVNRSQEKSFADIFSKELLKSTHRWALKEVNLAWKKAIMPLLLILVIGTGSTFGYKYWTQKKAADAELLRMQSEEAAKGQKVTVTESIKPWLKMPLAANFVAACSDALRHVGINGGNWQLKTVECAEGMLTVNWTKPNEYAWISHLKAVQPGAKFASDGLSASVSVPVSIQSANNAIDAIEVLPIQDGISLRYYDLGSRYGMTIRVERSAASVAPALLPGQQAVAQEVAPPKTWASFSVQVDTKIDPVQAASLLSYPGLRLQKITYAFTSGFFQYQLTGVQYVHP